MITAKEALSFVKLTATEEHSLAKLEAVVDGLIFEHFDGSPFNLTLADFISPKLAAALQRKFESRAFNDSAFWQVAYKPIEGEPGKDQRYAFSFVPMILPEVPKQDGQEKKLQTLPPVTSSTVQVQVTGKRLLVRMPTRGRPAQAIDVLTRYRVMAGIPITIEVVIDEDDETMMAPEILQRLYALGCVITVGRHGSKVAAVNAGRVKEWDVLLLASDDMVPVVDGYAKRAMAAMEEHFPYLDGAIYFDDGYQHEKCVTLPIMGKRLHDYFGYVYHSDYKSLFSDQEQTEVLSAMHKLKYVDEKIIEHRHWVMGARKDATYAHNDALWAADEATYKKRKSWGFNLAPINLSVLVCSLPSRKVQRERLLDHLWSQVQDTTRRFHGNVEILVDDREAIAIGEKRQALLERACGKFVAFVDDDDWVAHNYIDRILRALASDDSADCATLVGVMTTAGSSPEMFYNSLEYTEWHSKDRVHYRTPTHLSPVRRELALKAGFPSISHAEDHQYSVRLRPLLKHEVSTGSAILYYYFYFPGKTKEST